MVDDKEKKMKYDTRNGSPYDRGGADSYYGRDIKPHYYKGDTGNSKRIEAAQMTEEEIDAYMAGYNDNVESGSFKDWG
jgi:hypothetical protein